MQTINRLSPELTTTEQLTVGQTIYKASRRLFDLFAGSLGCLAFLLLVPLLWLINLVDSPGPLFYQQRRVGKDGRIFWMLKFRSMRVNAETTGAVWAIEGDPRATRIGLFLRKTHLDELPQCFNILKGEMSFIGPRPERPEFVEQLTQQLPTYSIRHRIQPGLTGWAQVNHDYGSGLEGARVKLNYDLYYLEQQSWLLDTQILLRTCFHVIGLKGR